jgi:hypothetical protein
MLGTPVPASQTLPSFKGEAPINTPQACPSLIVYTLGGDNRFPDQLLKSEASNSLNGGPTFSPWEADWFSSQTAPAGVCFK